MLVCAIDGLLNLLATILVGSGTGLVLLASARLEARQIVPRVGRDPRVDLGVIADVLRPVGEFPLSDQRGAAAAMRAAVVGVPFSFPAVPQGLT